MADWIVEQAAAQGVAVPAAEAAGIIRLAGPRTRDIVQLARGVWALSATSGGAVAGSAAVAFDAIVAEQGELYRTIFTKLTARQQGVLRAFAAEPDVQITSAAAQRRYRLGAKSTVQSTVSALVEAEHLVRDDGGGYTFDDPYFRRWVQLHALADIGESAPLLPG
jgi:hypothetical protein